MKSPCLAKSHLETLSPYSTMNTTSAGPQPEKNAMMSRMYQHRSPITLDRKSPDMGKRMFFLHFFRWEETKGDILDLFDFFGVLSHFFKYWPISNF